MFTRYTGYIIKVLILFGKLAQLIYSAKIFNFTTTMKQIKGLEALAQVHRSEYQPKAPGWFIRFGIEFRLIGKLNDYVLFWMTQTG